MAWTRLLLFVAVPPASRLRFHGQVGGDTLSRSPFVVDAATSDPTLFGSNSDPNVAYAYGGDESGDLDFEFELDLEDVDAATEDQFGTAQQHAEVELDARTGGSIAPRAFKYGRGVGYVTTQAVQSDELLFAVPLHQVMGLASARKGRIGVLLEVNPDLPPAVALAVHLLEERFLDIESNFSEYIERLPSIEAINSTIFYSQNELEMLEGSQIYRVTAARAKAVENFFSVLVGPVTSLAVDPPLFSKDEFTLENFRWALGIVWSHAFPVGGAEEDVVLAPVLDTIGVCVDDNGCPKNRIEVHPSAQQLLVYASKDYAPGEEVLMDMSDKASTMLMLNHGFMRVVPSRALDQVDISIFLDPNDALIDSQSMSMNDSYVLHYGGETLDEKLTTSLKIKLLQGNEMGRFKDLLGVAAQAQAEGKEYTEPRRIVSLRNEYVFARALLLTCKNLLQQYPMALEHDQAALDAIQDPLGASRKTPIPRMLALEKQIVHHAIQLAQQQWIDLLLSDHPNLLRTDGQKLVDLSRARSAVMQRMPSPQWFSLHVCIIGSVGWSVS
ncbi:putative ribulose-1,5 bisphosphate carboxylase/oxygenase small subunit n-methyltransferase i, partial [Globisporangium splendens]